jgi:hypothetical protein
MNKIVFRSLVNHLVDHKEIFETKLKEEFLFNDIKDHEIDQLFKEVRL